MASEIKVDTISEKTSANGVTIDGVNIKDSALATAGSVPLSTIDIDGGTDIGAAIVDADLFIIDDGAGGTNRKVAASRIKTYAGGSDPASADGDTLGTASLEWSDLYLADSSVIYFGNDQDTTLTHTDGTGLTLNSTNKLCFNDATQYIQGASGTVLDIAATDEIELTSTLVDLNGNLDVSGTTLLPTLGVITAKDLGVGVHIRVNDTGGDVHADADSLVIEDTAHMGMTLLTSNSTESRINFGDADANRQGAIGYDHSGEVMNFYSNQSAHTLSMKAGAVVINEGSADMDFRVESNGHTHALFVDAGNDRVGIGTSAVDTGGKCLTLKAMGSAGPQLILHQYNAADGWEFNAEDATGHLTISDSTAEEIFRFDDTGQLASGGETAADVGAGGLCLQQNAIDTHIMTFKSSDVAQGTTNLGQETDDFAFFRKSSATEGGLEMCGLSEGGVAMSIRGFGAAASTTKSTSGNACIRMQSMLIDGTGTTTQGSNANLFGISNDGTFRFFFDAEGDFHADSSSTTFDAYDDAQLARAFDLSKGKGVVDSKFDKFVAYNHEHLADLKLVGREEDGTPNHFMNVTGMQRLHNGAIWQQYEKHERLLEAVYDLAKEAVGEDKANAILDKHEVKRLQ
jgi:hypothetical protein